MEKTIEDLPPELLIVIFSHYIKSEGQMAFLRNMLPVCRKWWILSSTPSLWQSVDVPNVNCALSLARRGCLEHTKTLKLPDLNSYEFASHKICIQANEFLPMMLYRCPHYRPYTVLRHIRDLRSIEISYNSIINADTMMFVAKRCQNLEHLSMKHVSRSEFQELIRLEDLDPILTECGPKLKHLDFSFCTVQDGEQLITQIAVKCPALEVLEWHSYGFFIPIDKLVCVKLRKLDLDGCRPVMTGSSDCHGLKDLEVFKATRCEFHGADVYSLLKNSCNLKHLELDWNENLVLDDVSKIPSNEVRFLKIWLRDKNINLVAVEQAVHKWKLTLVHLKILGCRCDITSVLKIFLEDNQCPKLEVLCIEKDFVDHTFLQIFLQQCRNLKVLKFQDSGEYYGNPKEISKFAISCGQ